MDPDFSALASRLAARAEVLGCVILSRDGLVLGAFPPHGEQDITPGLLRFAALGDPERGFAQFSDELWAFVRAGAYAAFAVAEHGTRPGVLLDYLEQALLVAEEARLERSAVSEPAHVDLERKGIRPGRELRAAASAADEFRAAVFASEREAAAAHPAQDLPAVPRLGDGALDEAIAAALAEGAADGPTGSTEHEPAAAFAIEPEVGEISHELVGDEPSDEQQLPQDADQDPWQTPGARWQESGAGEPPGHPPDEGPDDAHHMGGDQDSAEVPGQPQKQVSEQMADWIPTHGAEHEPGPEEPPDEAHLRRPYQATGSPEEIDRVALAREFAQLLQEGPGGAEAGE